MTDELKQLIEDAAKLLGYSPFVIHDNCIYSSLSGKLMLNPLDPDRGDLRKLMEAAELVVGRGLVTDAWSSCYTVAVEYTKGDYQSLALAVLRAASAAWKARGE